MNLNNFVTGLEIIRKYYDEANGYHLSAEPGIVYVYPTDRPITTEDLETLFALDWFQPDVDTGDEDTSRVEQYDPQEGWGAFV